MVVPVQSQDGGALLRPPCLTRKDWGCRWSSALGGLEFLPVTSSVVHSLSLCPQGCREHGTGVGRWAAARHLVLGTHPSLAQVRCSLLPSGH